MKKRTAHSSLEYLHKDTHDYKNVHEYYQIFMLPINDENEEHTPN